MFALLAVGIGLSGGERVESIEAEIVWDAPTIRVGEPVFFSFRVHNRGAAPLWREVGGDYRNALGRADSFQCVLTDAAGMALPVPDSGFQMGGIMHMAELPPGAHHDQRLYLPNWGSPEAAGAHTLTCAITLQVGHSADFDTPRTSVPVSVEASLTVQPADAAAMGALIEALIARADGPDRYDVLRQLSSIDDVRVIPFFASQTTTSDPQQSIRALAKFSDDAALAGIVAALSISGEDIDNATNRKVAEQVAANHRIAAAQALSMSAHPGARAALYALSDDADDNIRLTVVHALGLDESSEATAMLRNFQRDRSGMVAGEARRYLSMR